MQYFSAGSHHPLPVPRRLCQQLEDQFPFSAKEEFLVRRRIQTYFVANPTASMVPEIRRSSYVVVQQSFQIHIPVTVVSKTTLYRLANPSYITVWDRICLLGQGYTISVVNLASYASDARQGGRSMKRLHPCNTLCLELCGRTFTVLRTGGILTLPLCDAIYAVCLTQCFPNFFARGPLLASKNNHGSSHHCSLQYKVSG